METGLAYHSCEVEQAAIREQKKTLRNYTNYEKYVLCLISHLTVCWRTFKY